MKKLLSEKGLVLVLFIFAIAIFSVANEDAKKSGLFQNSDNTAPTLFLSAETDRQAEAISTEMENLIESE